MLEVAVSEKFHVTLKLTSIIKFQVKQDGSNKKKDAPKVNVK